VDLDIKQSGKICTLKLKGHFKSGDPVLQFDAAVQSALSNGCLFFILDVESVPYIDSAAIGAVVDALRQSMKVGGNVKLINPSPFIAKTFKMVGILTLFQVFTTEAEAVAACG